VWGEGFTGIQLPPGARVIRLGSWTHGDNAQADVFLPISVMTERAGHFTNFEGQLGAFEACFDKPEGVADAQALFGALAQLLHKAVA